MTVSLTQKQAYIAGNKFGLGLRPAELASIGSDPRGWLQAQLTDIDRVPQAYAGMESSSEILVRGTTQMREARMLQQEAARTANSNTENPEQRRMLADAQRESRQMQAQYLGQRLQVAMTTDTPFAERLLRFWSNHFTIAEGGGAKRVLGQVGVAWENEAIRASLKGNFTQLLLNVEQHPAMLIYLDNNASIGPNSLIGSRRDRGLNENLAREILELHTMGVGGGYTQDDVTSLARIITGWTVAGLGAQQIAQGIPGSFQYMNAMHEPGTHTLLGVDYRADGVRQGERALEDLARHPSTARFIATKLARHFIADEPPQDAITVLETVFLATDGDLPSLHATLVDLDAAWDPALRKLKTPEELVISTSRALQLDQYTGRAAQRVLNSLVQIQTTFAQMPFTAPSPAGWPDRADFWGSGDALVKRIEWANSLTQAIPQPASATDLYPLLLPVQDTTQYELEQAENAAQALTLLLAGPDFQWR